MKKIILTTIIIGTATIGYFVFDKIANAPSELITNEFIEKTTRFTDGANTFYVPARHKIIKDETTNHQALVDEGLVIENEAGRQYVWIPLHKNDINTMVVDNQWGRLYSEDVGNVFDLDLSAKGYDAEQSKLVEPSSDFESILRGMGTEELESWPFDAAAKWEVVKESVKKYRGFYIERRPTPVGRNIEPFWTLAYDDAAPDSENSGFMMFGAMWDQMLLFMNERGIDIFDSSSYGFYIEHNNANVQVLNLYSIAGGYWELTAAVYEHEMLVSRGGSYTGFGSAAPVSSSYPILDASNISDVAVRGYLVIEP
ncbi:MAG: hypothetical protein LBQ02_04580 [Candidatus Nomurabacteria bacterium]|jgi:hypothetical protein|nr:hypothetical protein [Candidatus Nomurabacteria bacterium]